MWHKPSQHLKLDLDEIILQNQVITGEETTQTEPNAIGVRKIGTGEGKSIEADSSSDLLTSEEKQKITLELFDFFKAADDKPEAENIIKNVDPIPPLNASNVLTIFEKKPDEVITESRIHHLIQKPWEQFSIIQVEAVKKEEVLTMNTVLDIHDMYKDPFLPIVQTTSNKNELSPRSKIIYGQRHKNHKMKIGTGTTHSNRSPHLGVFEDSNDIIDLAGKVDGHSNKHVIHNRKQTETSDSKDSDTVIEIPAYDERIKESKSENSKREEFAPKSGIVPLIGMLGVGSFLYFLATNQST